MEKLVSILIPAFNAEVWIADTLKSALGQSWPRTEIIVVDDGSRDNTVGVVRQFESKRVKVVRQANQGAAAARNNAFSVCQGDYIQWLDADDLLHRDKILTQMEILGQDGNNRTLLSSAWGRFIYRPAKTRFIPNSLWCDLGPVEWMLRYLQKRHWMQTATWLVSRELTEAAGPWDTRLLGDDDGEYFCRVVLASNGIRFAPTSKVFYRRTSNSLSYVGRSQAKLEAQFLSMELQFRHLLSVENSERVRAACVDYLQHFLVYFYPDMPSVLKRANELASSLGGKLETPKLSWKYDWIRKSLGWPMAKRAQVRYNRIKSRLVRGCDHALFQLGL